jgi:hypothetical protein
MAIGTFKEIFGQKDVFGGKQFTVGDYSGTSSYTNTGTGSTSGDIVYPSTLGFFNSILNFIDISLDTTGTYYAEAQSTGLGLIGSGGWRIRWYVASTGAEVANGVNLSAISVKMSALGF